MLCAIRKSDRRPVSAYHMVKEQGPFQCPECGDPVVLKTGHNRINHFAHEHPLATHYSENESDEHRKCKMEIFEALCKLPNVRGAELERPMGANRPDIFAYINGTPVAIEVQLSNLSVETIMQRTIEYHRKGIYVLWLLPWVETLDRSRYMPRSWEKWLHAAYFGRVYYWLRDLEVVSYSFEPHLRTIPKKIWHAENGKQMIAGGYSRRSKNHRTAVRGRTLNLANDFVPKQRYWWKGNGIKVPDAKLFMHEPLHP